MNALRRYLLILIGIDPNIIRVGGFILSWHGLLTLVAVATAVVLVARWSRREDKIIPDDVFAVSTWAIIGGILGARLIHVIDRWDLYVQNPSKVFAVWEGGIALYGAILFGFVGGASYIWGRQLLGRIYSGDSMGWFKNIVGERIAKGYISGHMYARFKNFSAGRLADLTAPGLLLAQTIGRVGDIINGEHLSAATRSSWGFVYTHPSSLSYQHHGLNPSHPVIAYEMLWNALVLAIIWKLRGRLAPPGMLFATYLMLYSLGRFFIQFLRLDRVWFAGLQEAHVIALVVIVITVPLLAYKTQWVRSEATPVSSKRTRRPRSKIR